MVGHAKRVLASMLRAMADRLDPRDMEYAMRLAGWTWDGDHWVWSAAASDVSYMQHKTNGGV